MEVFQLQFIGEYDGVTVVIVGIKQGIEFTGIEYPQVLTAAIVNHIPLTSSDILHYYDNSFLSKGTKRE
jgi:hypothetical protein